ncbi:Retrovirus-related Pol polyprotein from transposon RE2 [Vitis vinifera]|uniref:Retrovirus-related Pol polyprotein from transposon RE2 n=1 Tax=Vitis vinifera TaxID=29760 RepID=A0A438CWX1_VITVI|nr:Retrovirus-related Pol polyprotein from transposon RE2 [Vitis vinifera]
MKEGKGWFAVESKSLEIYVELVKGKFVGLVAGKPFKEWKNGETSYRSKLQSNVAGKGAPGRLDYIGEEVKKLWCCPFLKCLYCPSCDLPILNGDRVSFWSPFPSPKAFRSAISWSKNPHHRQHFSGDIFRRLFPGDIFRHRPHHPECKEEICNFSQSTGAKHRSMRLHTPLFSSGLNPTRRRVRAHGPLSASSDGSSLPWPRPVCALERPLLHLQSLFSFVWVPTLDDVFARLLRLSSTQTFGNQGQGQRPQCIYCNKLGHTRDRCYQLHGRPPRTTHIAQSSDPLLSRPDSAASSTSQSITLTGSDYDAYLRYQAATSTFVASVAHTGNASVCFTQSPSLGPWILDSGASDHISGNKHIFSSITTTSTLPTVTLANGSQTMAKGIGLAHPLPSLPLHSVLYAPECPFNLIFISKITRTLNYSITFSDKSMILQDRSTGKTIGIGRESQGLYHLTSPSSPAVCISTDVPLLIHSCLGHPSLSKFQKMVPRFSTLSSLACESCQLGKHTRVSFPKRLNNREKSPFELVHTNDKLSAKATKCIFLGYSRLQKGYRCYSPDTHRYFLSVDVTFFEDSPFFSSSESLPISEVLPLPYISPLQMRSLVLFRFIIVDIVLLLLLSLQLSYHRLSSSYSAFVSTLSSVSLPKSTSEALSHPGWRRAMVDEMVALHSNGTWDLVSLPSSKSIVGCRWVYTVKVGPDGQVDRLKARLIAKGYTQIYGCDYGDTFSPVAKIASEVYMEQPPGFVAQGESSLVCKLRRSLYGLKQSPWAWFGHFSSVVQKFGMLRSEADHSVFYHHNSSSQCIYLVVYVDGIVITGSDQEGMVMSQRKYVLDILEETGILECKPVDTPMDPNVKLVPGQGEPLRDPRRYRRLVSKLNYLTITRPNISFPVSVVSQFLQSPCDNHWDAVIRILRYIKGTPGQGMLYEDRGHTQIVGYTDADWAGSPSDRRSTSGYCVFIGGNLISWKSKKQDVVAKSSAETEYRAMALATCELIWLRQLLQELRFRKDEQIKLVCENQAALHIASNPVFHERTKHIEVDCHFIREKIASRCVATSFVNSNNQLADIFTKSLKGVNGCLEEVKGWILDQKPLPSIHEVFSLVRQEECWKRIMLSSPEPSLKTEPRSSALVSQGP